MKKTLSVLLMILLASSLFATGTVEYKDAVETARDEGSFTMLVRALEATGIDETLKGFGPFTLFAPTDEAFAGLPDGLLEVLFEDIPTLRQILLYHVVRRNLRAGEMITLDRASTAQGENVVIDVRGDNAFVDHAQVIQTNIDTSNGVMHVIDSVMVPSSIDIGKLLLPDIVDVVVADSRFTTFMAAIEAADLVDMLKSHGPFTVFAPTDDAFAKLPDGAIAALLGDIPQLTEILLYHVVSREMMAEQVVALSNATTVQGQPVVIRVDMGSVYVNNAQVVITDVQAVNGVIHVIDTVIVPPRGNIVAVLRADGRFATLLTAVETAGLVETLSSGGPFTLLAPADSAFVQLPVGTVSMILGDVPRLTDILRYHVVEGRAFFGDIVKLSSIPTLQGEPIAISTSGSGVLLNGEASVSEADILATNGVIHVIDSVILLSDDE